MKYLMSLCLFMTAFIMPVISKADTLADADNEILDFTLDCASAQWMDAGEPLPLPDSRINSEIRYKALAGNSAWTATNVERYSTFLRVGATYEDTKVSFFNSSPIKDRISKIIFHKELLYADYGWCLQGVTLYIADNEEMSAATELKYEGDLTLNGAHEFIIPDPMPDMYYRIEFDCAKSVHYNSSGNIDRCDYSWMQISSFKFYRERHDAPVINLCSVSNVPDHLEIVSESGDLHLIIHEYDVDNNFYREIIGPSSRAGVSSTRASAAPEYDENWTNKVASANETYQVNFPSEQGHYIYIRAKTVNGETHSPETATVYTSAGIETGIITTTPDSQDQTAVYFDIQGRPVSDPSIPGLYLRRQNNHTTKIIIK